MKILMASIRETDLSMDDIEELIGMQSYAVLLNKISVISDFRFSLILTVLPTCWSIGYFVNILLTPIPTQYPYKLTIINTIEM